MSDLFIVDEMYTGDLFIVDEMYTGDFETGGLEMDVYGYAEISILIVFIVFMARLSIREHFERGILPEPNAMRKVNRSLSKKWGFQLAINAANRPNPPKNYLAFSVESGAHMNAEDQSRSYRMLANHPKADDYILGLDDGVIYSKSDKKRVTSSRELLAIIVEQENKGL